MPRLAQAALLLLLSAPLGCMRSLDIRHSTPLAATATPARLPGIPFYARTGICQQQSIWLEPQYTLHFHSGEDSEQQLTLDAATFNSPSIQHLLAQPTTTGWKALLLGNPQPASINEVDPNAIQSQQQLHNWQLVSNTATILPIVDYGHVFYLNSARPLTGSAQATAKLAADGTLTEGSAQLEDKTLSTVVTSIASLASTATTAGALAAFAPNAGGPDLHLNVSTHFYLHTHTLLTPPATPLACTPASPAVLTGSFTVSEPATAAAPTHPDPNAVSVSGTIKLPAPKP